jgi:hypothetical protein
MSLCDEGVGDEWGIERGEKRKFADLWTNHSVTWIEFIRDEFVGFGNETTFYLSGE